MGTVRVRRIREGDRAFVSTFLQRHRLPATLTSRGHLHELESLPGIVVLRDADPIGLLLYTVEDAAMEIVLLRVVWERIGLGPVLVREARRTARRRGCTRLWVVVTNDDTKALRFYQRNDFRLVAFYPEARDIARDENPELPRIGAGGIPVHDEIELELPITPAGTDAPAS